MQRELVEQRRWIFEARFLHALGMDWLSMAIGASRP